MFLELSLKVAETKNFAQHALSGDASSQEFNTASFCLRASSALGPWVCRPTAPGMTTSLEFLPTCNPKPSTASQQECIGYSTLQSFRHDTNP